MKSADNTNCIVMDACTACAHAVQILLFVTINLCFKSLYKNLGYAKGNNF